MDAIREDIAILTLLAEVLCFLDMMVNSFAHTVSTKLVGRYTRPEFTGKVFMSNFLLEIIFFCFTHNEKISLM